MRQKTGRHLTSAAVAASTALTLWLGGGTASAKDLTLTCKDDFAHRKLSDGTYVAPLVGVRLRQIWHPKEPWEQSLAPMLPVYHGVNFDAAPGPITQLGSVTREVEASLDFSLELKPLQIAAIKTWFKDNYRISIVAEGATEERLNDHLRDLNGEADRYLAPDYRPKPSKVLLSELRSYTPADGKKPVLLKVVTSIIRARTFTLTEERRKKVGAGVDVVKIGGASFNVTVRCARTLTYSEGAMALYTLGSAWYHPQRMTAWLENRRDAPRPFDKFPE